MRRAIKEYLFYQRTVKTIDDLKEVADAADKAALDAKQVVELINRRVF